MGTDIEKAKANDYSKGYAAGKRLSDRARDEGYQQGLRDAGGPPEIRRYDDLMSKALNTVLEHCSNWSIGGEKITNSDGYVKLAKTFVDNMISSGPRN